MPRAVPESRFQDLIEAATAAFIARGFRLTQMSDVAQALGVAKGTVYLYVESKEALLAAVLRFADGRVPPVSELSLPLAAPKPADLHAEIASALAEETLPPALQEALRRARTDDVRAELEAIVRGLYALASARRTVIKLVDRCARDLPELAALFYAGGRFAQVDAVARYLEARRFQLRPLPDVATAARFVVEAVATWAVHIHWDPAPQDIDPADAEDTVVQFVLGGLVKE